MLNKKFRVGYWYTNYNSGYHISSGTRPRDIYLYDVEFDTYEEAEDYAKTKLNSSIGSNSYVIIELKANIKVVPKYDTIIETYK